MLLKNQHKNANMYFKAYIIDELTISKVNLVDHSIGGKGLIFRDYKWKGTIRKMGD